MYKKGWDLYGQWSEQGLFSGSKKFTNYKAIQREITTADLKVYESCWNGRLALRSAKQSKKDKNGL